MTQVTITHAHVVRELQGPDLIQIMLEGPGGTQKFEVQTPRGKAREILHALGVAECAFDEVIEERVRNALRAKRIHHETFKVEGL